MDSSESEYSKINSEKLVSFIELTTLAKQKQLEIESAFKWLNGLSPQMDLEIHRTILSVSLEKIKKDIKDYTDLKLKLKGLLENIEDVRDIVLNECAPSKIIDTESFHTDPVDSGSYLEQQTGHAANNTLIFGNEPKEVKAAEAETDAANSINEDGSHKDNVNVEKLENDDTSLSDDTIEDDIKEQRALVEFFGKSTVKTKTTTTTNDEYDTDGYQDSWKMRSEESDSASVPDHVSVGPSIPAEFFDLDELLNNTSEKNVLPLKRITDDQYYKSNDTDDLEEDKISENTPVANPKHTIIEYSFPLKDFSRDEYQEENIEVEGDK